MKKLVAIEKLYQEYDKIFCSCYDSEMNEFAPLNLNDGEMVLLGKGTFHKIAQHRELCDVYNKFRKAGLTDIESVVIMSFLADISAFYRRDSYRNGIPPLVDSLCDILNDGLSKFPAYSGNVVRACNEYDCSNFREEDSFTPKFCLTASGDLTWQNKSENRYNIQPLSKYETKARAIYWVHDNGERQVTFLQDAKFVVERVAEWGEGKKQIYMREIR